MSNNAKLGRGLDKLFESARTRKAETAPPAAEAPKAAEPKGVPAKDGVERIPLPRIDANPWQPRREFAADQLDELVESMREHGLLQPVTVRRNGDRYELIAGERRTRAARLLEWTSIPALVRETTDREMLELAILENLQRSDLSPIDVALAYKRLMDEFNLTQEAVAKKVSTSRPAVANTLRLLELSATIRTLISKNQISAGAGRALLGFADLRRREELARHVAEGLLTVRQLEELAQSERKPMSKPTGARPADANLGEMVSTLSRTLGMKVGLRGGRERGVLSIRYADRRQLDQLYKVLSTRPAAKTPQPLEEDEDEAMTT